MGKIVGLTFPDNCKQRPKPADKEEKTYSKKKGQ